MKVLPEYKLIAGVDEAGRGPLAGPVTAAAVILDQSSLISGLDDSKKLSASQRKDLEIEIKSRAVCWCIAHASVEEIDQINILQATMLAMSRAVDGLKVKPDFVRVDGNRLPDIKFDGEAIVKGDSLFAEISAASILAKQERDRIMDALCIQYPQYGFGQHKGYPTKAHIAAIEADGICPHHRKSFSPIRQMIEQ